MKDPTRAAFASTTAATVTATGGVMTSQSADTACICFEPGVETIDVEQVLAAEMRQKVVEFDMTVPQREPDIGQVVDVYVKHVKIQNIDVIPNKVIIRGNLEVKVMYVAKLPNDPVHAFEREHVKFTRDIDVDGAMPDMKATADCMVEYVDYDFNDCDPRKVHVTIVLKFWTRVTTTTEMEITALSPVDEMGVAEHNSASVSSGGIGSATQSNETNVAASQLASNYDQNSMQSGAAGPIVQTVEEAVPEAGVSQAISGKTGTVSGSNVNVRTGPGTNYPSILKASKGTAVTIKEQAFGWYKVILNDGNTTGWIASWFVRLDA